MGLGREVNRRSLHCAPPDFPLRLVALMDYMRLALRRAAHVVLTSISEWEIRVRSGRHDKVVATVGLSFPRNCSRLLSNFVDSTGAYPQKRNLDKVWRLPNAFALGQFLVVTIPCAGPGAARLAGAFETWSSARARSRMPRRISLVFTAANPRWRPSRISIPWQ